MQLLFYKLACEHLRKPCVRLLIKTSSMALYSHHKKAQNVANHTGKLDMSRLLDDSEGIRSFKIQRNQQKNLKFMLLTKNGGFHTHIVVCSAFYKDCLLFHLVSQTSGYKITLGELFSFHQSVGYVRTEIQNDVASLYKKKVNQRKIRF